MAAAPAQSISRPPKNAMVEQWFFLEMSLAMIAICCLAFFPAIVHPEERPASLSTLAGVHGIVFSAWLLLFLVQSSLIATWHVAWHRRLGILSVFLLALMIPLTYTMAV